MLLYTRPIGAKEYFSVIREKFLAVKNKILNAQRPPLEPVLNIIVYRDGAQIDFFSSADSQELQRRNMSRLVAIFERYKTDIVHSHETGEIRIYVGKTKNDILYADNGVKDKNNKKEE